MPVMTQELQTAYNEWLLLFGFRVVPFNEMHTANTILESTKIPYADWQRFLKYYGKLDAYQLRTMEEIEIYDENKITLDITYLHV